MSIEDDLREERDQFEHDLGDANDKIDVPTGQLGDANDKIEKMEEAMGRIWEESRKWA